MWHTWTSFGLNGLKKSKKFMHYFWLERLGVIWITTCSQTLSSKASYIFLKAQSGLDNLCVCLAFADFLNVVTMKCRLLSRNDLFFFPSLPCVCTTSLWCEAGKKGVQALALPAVSRSSPLRLPKPAHTWHVNAQVLLHPRSVFWNRVLHGDLLKINCQAAV